MPKMQLTDTEKEEILRWRAKRAIWNEAIEKAIEVVHNAQSLEQAAGQLVLLKKD